MLTIEERCHQWYCDMQTARSEEDGDAVVERHLREAIAEEREACAGVCRERAERAERSAKSAVLAVGRIAANLAAVEAYECAAAIRARGAAPDESEG